MEPRILAQNTSALKAIALARYGLDPCYGLPLYKISFLSMDCGLENQLTSFYL
jgi:hypothetical protein